MKKRTIFTILAGFLTALFLTNCGGDSGGDSGGNSGNDNVLTLSVSPTSIIFDENTIRTKIMVTSNTDWTIKSADSWARCSVQSGSGSLEVIVIADGTTTKDRYSILTISDMTGTKTATVSITQKAPDNNPSGDLEPSLGRDDYGADKNLNNK